ncbi:SDR family oxidoreductase [Pseudarthrobacter sp. NPDC058196]|uniref:SDR family oxidoreductase n=1 Tax=Pseudarthrobacter sp. NPDC058196 TaxID=3346376 RepID=UPI0036D9FACD
MVIADINAGAATEAAAKIGGGERAVGVGCNGAVGEDMNALVQAATGSFGSPDVFVNNAGITRDATMRKMTEEMFDQVLAVHLRGSWLHLGSRKCDARAGEGRLDRKYLIDLEQSRIHGATNCSATKAGIIGLTKAAAKEVGFAGVRVNAVQPGLIRTPLTETMREDIMEARLKEIALGRMGEAAEIAQAALFVASDISSYMSGTVLGVTGGRHM